MQRAQLDNNGAVVAKAQTLEAAIQGLRENTVVEINLMGQNLTGEPIRHLIEEFKAVCEQAINLEVLNLGDIHGVEQPCYLKPEEVELLLTTLSSMKYLNLKVLRIGLNDFDDRDASVNALIEVIKSNSELTYLSLNKTSIEAENLNRILKAAVGLSSLRILRLCYLPVAVCTDALCDLTRHMPRVAIETVGVGYDDNNIEPLLNHIQNNRYCSYQLTLSSAQLNSDNKAKMCKAVSNNDWIEEVVFHYQYPSVEEMQYYAHMVAQRPQIKYHLGFNGLSLAHISAFFRALEQQSVAQLAAIRWVALGDEISLNPDAMEEGNKFAEEIISFLNNHPEFVGDIRLKYCNDSEINISESKLVDIKSAIEKNRKKTEVDLLAVKGLNKLLKDFPNYTSRTVKLFEMLQDRGMFNIEYNNYGAQPECYFNDNSMRHLIYFLKQNTWITSLKLSHGIFKGVSTAVRHDLLRTVGAMQQLKLLELQQNHLNNKDISVLFEVFTKTHQLETLNLRGNQLEGNDALKSMVCKLQSSTLAVLVLACNKHLKWSRDILSHPGLVALKELDVSEIHFGDEELNVLASDISKHSNMRRWILNGCQVTHLSKSGVVEALRKHPSLIHIELKDNNLSKNCLIESIDELFIQNHLLHTFNLDGNEAVSIGMREKIAGYLQRNALTQSKTMVVNGLINLLQVAETETLTIKGPFEDKDVYQLADFIGKSQVCELKDLTIRHTRMTSYGLAALMTGLRKAGYLEKLETIIIDRTAIQSEGGKVMAENLTHCLKLTSLELTSTCIGVLGAQALAEVLQQCPTLTRLRLYHNQFRLRGLEALMAVLNETGIKYLELSANQIGTGGGALISAMLHHNTTLNVLNLRTNALRSQDICDIAAAIESNSEAQIQTIWLGTEGNHVGDQGAEALAQMLRVHQQNIFLELSCAGITDAGAQALKTAVERSNYDIEVQLMGSGVGAPNSISEQLLEYFAMASQRHQILGAVIHGLRKNTMHEISLGGQAISGAPFEHLLRVLRDIDSTSRLKVLSLGHWASNGKGRCRLTPVELESLLKVLTIQTHIQLEKLSLAQADWGQNDAVVNALSTYLETAHAAKNLNVMQPRSQRVAGEGYTTWSEAGYTSFLKAVGRSRLIRLDICGLPIASCIDNLTEALQACPLSLNMQSENPKVYSGNPNVQFKDENIEPLLVALRTNQFHGVRLDLRSAELSEAGITRLADALSGNTFVKTILLQLNRKPFTVESMVDCARLLVAQPERTLYLNKNELTTAHLNALLTALLESPVDRLAGIKAIDLGDESFNDKVTQAINQFQGFPLSKEFFQLVRVGNIEALRNYQVQLSQLQDRKFDGLRKIAIEKEKQQDRYESCSLTLLGWAADAGHKAIVDFLIEINFSVNVGKSEGQRTPLSYAVEKNHLEVVETLLRAGADVNVRFGKKEGHVLITAGKCASLSIVQRLVEHGADVNARILVDAAKQTHGSSALHYAVLYNRDKHVAEYLLERGIEVNAKGTSGYYSLHCAMMGGRPEGKENEERIAKLKLLLQYKPNLDVLDKNRYTPLHYAVKNGLTDCVKVLVEAGATINLKNSPDIIKTAEQKEYYALKSYLLEHANQADVENQDSNTQAITAASNIIESLRQNTLTEAHLSGYVLSGVLFQRLKSALLQATESPHTQLKALHLGGYIPGRDDGSCRLTQVEAYQLIALLNKLSDKLPLTHLSLGHMNLSSGDCKKELIVYLGSNTHLENLSLLDTHIERKQLSCILDAIPANTGLKLLALDSLNAGFCLEALHSLHVRVAAARLLPGNTSGLRVSTHIGFWRENMNKLEEYLDLNKNIGSLLDLRTRFTPGPMRMQSLCAAIQKNTYINNVRFKFLDVPDQMVMVPLAKLLIERPDIKLDLSHCHLKDTHIQLLFDTLSEASSHSLNRLRQIQGLQLDNNTLTVESTKIINHFLEIHPELSDKMKWLSEHFTKKSKPFAADHTGKIRALIFDKHLKRLYTGSRDHSIRAWELNDGEYRGKFEGHGSCIYSLALNTDGSRLYSGAGNTVQACDDYSIRIWNTQTRLCEHSLKGHTGTVHALTLDMKRNRLYSGAHDGLIYVWASETGEQLDEYSIGKRVHALALNVQGDRLYSGDDAGHIRVWGTITGTCIQTIETHSPVLALIFGPDGRLYSGHHYTAEKADVLQAWNVVTYACEATFKGHIDHVHVLQFGPTGYLYTGSSDGTFRVWDVASGQCVKILIDYPGLHTALTFDHQQRLCVPDDKQSFLLIEAHQYLPSITDLKVIEGVLDLKQFSVAQDALSDKLHRVSDPLNTLHMNVRELDPKALKEQKSLKIKLSGLRELTLTHNNWTGLLLTNWFKLLEGGSLDTLHILGGHLDDDLAVVIADNLKCLKNLMFLHISAESMTTMGAKDLLDAKSQQPVIIQLKSAEQIPADIQQALMRVTPIAHLTALSTRDKAKCGYDIDPIEDTLSLAVYHRYVEALDQYYDAYVPVANRATPLHYAAYVGDASLLQKLLEAGFEKDALDSHGFTPLHYAVLNSQLATVQALITTGVSIEAKTGAFAKQRQGLRPLKLAKTYLTKPGRQLLKQAIKSELEQEKEQRVAKERELEAKNSELLQEQQQRVAKERELEAKNSELLQEQQQRVAKERELGAKNSELLQEQQQRAAKEKELEAIKSELLQERQQREKKERELAATQLRLKTARSALLPTIPSNTVDKEETPLAQGGYGFVYRGEWLGELIAVKELINPNLTNDAIKEFKGEALKMAHLRSPYVVMVYGITLNAQGRLKGIVMEYMPQGSLDRILGNRGIALRWLVRHKMALAVTRGLSYLHQQNIIHNDLKSLNVLVRQQGDEWVLKLTDFGLSRIKQETSRFTGQPQGTPAWMAPELFEQNTYSKASDVYAYGIVLWEIVSREIPFRGKTSIQIGRLVCDKEERPPISPEMPSSLATLMQLCWKQNQVERLPTEELITKLEALPLKQELREFDARDDVVGELQNQSVDRNTPSQFSM